MLSNVNETGCVAAKICCKRARVSAVGSTPGTNGKLIVMCAGKPREAIGSYSDRKRPTSGSALGHGHYESGSRLAFGLIWRHVRSLALQIETGDILTTSAFGLRSQTSLRARILDARQCGGPSGTRTQDLRIKSPLLWPTELRAQGQFRGDSGRRDPLSPRSSRGAGLRQLPQKGELDVDSVGLGALRGRERRRWRSR